MPGKTTELHEPPPAKAPQQPEAKPGDGVSNATKGSTRCATFRSWCKTNMTPGGVIGLLIARATISAFWYIIAIVLYISVVYYGIPKERPVQCLPTAPAKADTTNISLPLGATASRSIPPSAAPIATPELSAHRYPTAAVAPVAGSSSGWWWAPYTGLRTYLSGVQFAPVHRTRYFVLWAISISPYLITLWIFALLTVKAKSLRLTLVLPDNFSLAGQFDAAGTKEIRGQVEEEWESEQRGTGRTRARGNEYAHFLGLFASAILSASTLIYAWYSAADGTFQHGQKLAITLWVATAFGFGLALGRIVMRLANSDASPRMFAAATRTLISSALSAFFLSLLFDFLGENKLSATPVGCAVLGAAVAVIGNRMLDNIIERAEALLNVSARPPMPQADLQLIDGLIEGDAERLAEEAIDSVHALAFFPTARLFMNTVYGLQRICDWQDQAFLIVYLGKEKAQTFRQQLTLRGAAEVQGLAKNLLPRLKPDDPANKFYALLGFTDAGLCQAALENIASNRLLAQLQVLKAAIVEKQESEL